MKSFPHKGRLGIAAAGMASLLLVGCGSGSGSSGPESSAALMTGDPTETASTAASSQDASSTVTSSHGAEPASFMAEAELHTPDGEQIGTVDFAVDGSCTNVTCPNRSSFGLLLPGEPNLDIPARGSPEISDINGLLRPPNYQLC